MCSTRDDESETIEYNGIENADSIGFTCEARVLWKSKVVGRIVHFSTSSVSGSCDWSNGFMEDNDGIKFDIGSVPDLLPDEHAKIIRLFGEAEATPRECFSGRLKETAGISKETLEFLEKQCSLNK